MKWSGLDYLSSRSANDRALSARQPPALWGGEAERHGGFHDNISQMSSVVPHRAAALHKLGGKKKTKNLELASRGEPHIHSSASGRRVLHPPRRLLQLLVTTLLISRVFEELRPNPAMRCCRFVRLRVTQRLVTRHRH